MTEKKKEQKIIAGLPKEDYFKLYYQKHGEFMKLSYKTKYRELRLIAENLIGNRCILCNTLKKVCFHEKNGKNHYIRNKGYVSNLRFYIENYQDFVPLCSYCHKEVHRIQKHQAKGLDLKKLLELQRLLLT
jgi:hypothetical protein